jgi:poly(glycerol-phosphate) alpha-glucosyltransferase
VPTPALPEGLYFTLNHKMVPSTGGRTRTLMMRNRILRERYGVEPSVLSLDDNPSHAATRQYLVDHGELVDGVHMLNLFEWLRERDLTELRAIGETLPDELPPLEHTFAEEVAHPDGTTYYTSYRTKNTLLEVARDYRRPDGSVFLRAPSTTTVLKDTPLYLVDATGRPLRRWSRLGQLQKFWLKQLAGDAERVFVVCDRRTVLPELLPFRDQRFLFFLVLHNNHLIGGGRHWSLADRPGLPPCTRGDPAPRRPGDADRGAAW